jgi:NADH-quinone oxidoreductase subunit C
MSEKDQSTLQQQFSEAVVSTLEFRGEHTITVTLKSLHDVLNYCKNTLGYDMLIDVSSLDFFGKEPRFMMVYELATLNNSKHLRIKAAVEEDQEVPSAVDIWLAADWHEREVYDMMGIRFSNHPNLKRILMWEGYPFHPLRKDFPLAGRPSEMPDVAFTGVAPLEGGPFVTACGTDDVVRREPRARDQK